jgi:adenosine deaminase
MVDDPLLQRALEAGHAGLSDATCLLLGGDDGHFTQHSFPGLFPAISAAGLVPDFVTKGPALSASKLAGKKVLIIFADGYTTSGHVRDAQGKAVRTSGPSWMSPEQAQDVEDFILAGGALLTIHNSLWGYPIDPRDEADPEAMARELRDVQTVLSASNAPMTTEQAGLADPARMGPYRRACGGIGGYHPAFERQSVHVLDTAHPITAGVSAFELHDEQHFVFFDEHLGARMFLKSRGSDGRESCAGYSYQHGAGRVCYLAPGHVPLASQPGMDLPPGEPDAISHPMVQLLYRNAVRWLADGSTAESPGVRPAQPPRDLRALPKAHLHLHLEGAMRPSTLTDLCAKHGIHRPADTAGLRFDGFGAFAGAYGAACECLRDESDLRRLLEEVVEDARRDGALWVELAPSLPVYAERFGGTAATLKLLLDMAAEVEASSGVGIGYICSGTRDAPPSEAEELAVIARAAAEAEVTRGVRPHAIVGFGLHADEGGNPPEPFARAFEIACGGDSPLAAMPHAGEIAPSPGSGAESVRYCVEELGARRIAHGVLASEDDSLVAELARLGVCCDVCPTSNYLLSVVESLERHPLPQLLAAGVKCSINADDPLLFGSGLLFEFEACRAALGMSDAVLAACAATSFEHARCPDVLRRRGLDGVAAWLRGSARDAKL